MTLRPTPVSSTLSQLARLVNASVSEEVLVTGITHNSKDAVAGDLYVAIPGSNHHGIEFLAEAVANGAVAVATDSDGASKANELNVPCLVLSDARRDMAPLAAHLYGEPQNKLSIVGVTGTNGKTTTTHMLRSIFLDAGKSVGVIGTLGTFINGEHIPGARTTPESTDLFALLAVMAERGVTNVFMEVSSHALVLNRVGSMKFDVAVFTNLTQDHLDFHGDMESYFDAKASLFDAKYSRNAVICEVDSWGQKLAAEISIPAITIGSTGDWKPATPISRTPGITEVDIVTPAESIHVEVNMFGSFNAMNAAAALAVCETLGFDRDAALQSLCNIRAIPGRFEIVEHQASGVAFVDYAHTPDAVTTVLSVVRDSKPTRVITVLGCGGDRDALKRPLMGKAAAELSDLVIVTDDNPRSEVPEHIRAAVLAGAVSGSAEVIEIGDRREAIRFALASAKPGDVVAVLGKGHETGQEIAGVIHPFDDRVVIAEEAANV